MKKKLAKKANKAKTASSKKAAPKKVAKKSKPAPKKTKPVAKKSKPAPKKVMPKKVVKKSKPLAKKKVEKKVVKLKVQPKKVMKKPEPKKIKEVTKAPVASKKETKPVLAPRVEVKVSAPVAKIEPPKVVSNKNEKTHYSERDLVEFRKLIVDKLDQARKDYDLLKNTLCHTDDHGTDDTSPTFKALEDGSDVLTREETAQLALRQEKFIQNLQNALIRIENKTYGICRVTGKLIPKERLLRVPHATLSIDAKKEQQFN